MIETLLGWAASQIPGLFVGGLGGAIGAFFFIQRKLKKNPKWVEDLYQKQRAVGMQGTDELDKLKKQIADMELAKTIAELKEKVAKLGG